MIDKNIYRDKKDDNGSVGGAIFCFKGILWLQLMFFMLLNLLLRWAAPPNYTHALASVGNFTAATQERLLRAGKDLCFALCVSQMHTRALFPHTHA